MTEGGDNPYNTLNVQSARVVYAVIVGLSKSCLSVVPC